MLCVSGERVEIGEVTGDWSDKWVYVIGGGPSLTGFDFSKLDGYTVGANKSAFVANADALISIDWKFLENSIEDIKAYKGEKYYGILNQAKLYYDPELTYLTCHREGSLTTNPKEVVGLNSGYAALNIAFLKKAKKIGLLGFDMQIDTVKHFHGGYPWDKSRANTYNSWARRFRYAKTKLQEHEIQVVNYVGPKGSGISEYFPTRPLEELQ